MTKPTKGSNEIRLYDFNTSNIIDECYQEDDGFNGRGSNNSWDSDEYERKKSNEFREDNKILRIQMFGMDERGYTYSINVDDYKPYFYVKVPENANAFVIKQFINEIREDVKMEALSENKKNGKGYKPTSYENSLIETKVVMKKKLYGFDQGKEYKFIKLTFSNLTAFNKYVGLWHTKHADFRKRELHDYIFKMNKKNYPFKIYEAKLPPLLRFFHDLNISPSGWIKFKRKIHFVSGTRNRETEIGRAHV